jgi:hypothetical protein
MGERDADAATARQVLTSDPDLEPVDEGGARGGGRRTLLRAAATLAAVIALGAGAAVFLRWAHFVGADETTGHVAVYQGLPIELFAGVKLYHEVQDTPIAYASLDQETRKQLFDHTIRSKSSAVTAAEHAGDGQP